MSLALSPDDLTRAVHENLAHLGLDVLDVVNLRVRAGGPPGDESLEAPFTALADLRQQGLIRHLGLSNVSTAQLAEARSIAPVVTVQNLYNPAAPFDGPVVLPPMYGASSTAVIALVAIVINVLVIPRARCCLASATGKGRRPGAGKGRWRKQAGMLASAPWDTRC